jgi:hypothetical protein
VLNLAKTVEEWGTRLGAHLQAALGALSSSLAIYVLGYLVLRFHLTALGVGTDVGLHLMDERYFFAGAKFLVYVVAAIPNVLVLALPFAALGYLLYRLLPGRARTRLAEWADGLSPKALGWAGVALAVLVIQLLMRKVFYFNNLLVTPNLEGAPTWLVRTACRSDRLPLYFSSLIAACVLSAALLYFSRKRASTGHSVPAGVWLLGFLLAIEVGFLPLTYGYLVFDKEIARVSTLDGQAPLLPGQQAWLVWETEHSATYLVQEVDGARDLVTIKGDDIKRKVITGYDFLLQRFFTNACRS